MRRLRLAALAAALLTYGSALPRSVAAWEPDPDRCGGSTPPVCRVRTVETCTDWYACDWFRICCRVWERSTQTIYFPELE